MPKKFMTFAVDKIVKQLSRSHANLRKKPYLNVVFVNSDEMKKINYSYRHKNYVTDILSFASDEPKTLGELVICPQKIKKQAIEHGLSFKLELLYMLIHGVLHLLGYDHERSNKEEKLMMDIQDRLFSNLSKQFK